MKVRIAQNKIRFRLKQPEVSGFLETGRVEELLEFGSGPPDQLCFRVEIFSGSSLAIEFTNNTTTVRVPKSLAETWVNTDLVGFQETVTSEKGRRIEVLVEKDFVCMDG